MSDFIDRPRYSCALGGALGTIRALPKVVPIMHAAAGCGGNLSSAINFGAGYVGSGYCSGQALPSTNVIERDIVFGGENRLREQIENTLKIVDGDLYVVLTACMVDMIGDDSRSVTKEFSDHRVPVLFAETGGFKGNSYKGYDLVLETLFRDFVEKTDEKEEKTINLLGIVPIQDVFWQGNLRILKELFEKLGYKLNTFFGEGETIEDLKKSSRSKLNIVVSDIFGIDAAKVFEEVHGVPFVTTQFPIGEKSTNKFLREIGKVLEVPECLVENIIREEKKNYYNYIERIVDIYNDIDLQRYSVVVGDSNYTQALARFLADDLGWLPELVVITDELEEKDKELVLKRFEQYESGFKPNVIFDTNTSSIEKHLNDIWPNNKESIYYDSFSPAFVIGSSFEKDLAKRIDAPHLSVTYPISNRVVLDKGYAGYRGALSLVEDLFGILVEKR
ncbi:nitrogenase molybdenum-iron protein beta subunit NifK [Gottschalkia acidurici 9a]|uniref:Nitrogenase molybdenum-iron protein beta subunit NifK n=1 Tax=Gottschalkia acidurici (strain ATCC 7906 / DSM 604 / BCRC 14475 / CIP 104303 / KCTC 5404 / NCIMB 10678 / 9a) TaxID=1128398 RepID=K0AZE0_GOTA9|nr:nitrogenase component 1 [Gottschalkia acidurici]AFS79168.1 nitrogenase molybdenum-iron protein beta subunit NifK [Gottschalkia acidurici 9a]